jgi:hypothetical protein
MAWDQNFRLPRRRFFTSIQLAQVEGLFRALHPADPARGIPGAGEAGAAQFLDLLLSPDQTANYEEIPIWRRRYPDWLAALDSAAQARAGKALTALNAAETTELLAALEQGRLAGLADQALTFKTLWRHCLQGCWSDPRWGGNQGGIMWRWLGYLQDAETVELKG